MSSCPDIQSVLSDDPGTDLVDELCHLSLLQVSISPLPESGDDVLMSPSQYPAPPVPTMDISVTPALPVDSDYVSPGSPASMDHFLAGDSLLMDGPSDLPLLQLPLLPLPDAGVLPPGPVADPPGPNDHPSRDPLMHTWIQLLPGMFLWCWIVCQDVNTG